MSVTPNPDQNNETPKYAGKFNSVEDLEAGYKNAAKVFDENQALKTQLDSITKVPDNYMNPSDVELDESRVADIQARAKESGMTQAQYEKFLRSDKARVDQHKQKFEDARKELGDENINILTDYVSKYYPKELQDNMLKTFIRDKNARQAALNHRQQLLSNTVPGVRSVSAPSGYTVTQQDVRKAYDAKEKNKGDMKARQHYMNLLAAQAEQNQAG